MFSSSGQVRFSVMMELLIWNKYWGLPSIDADCLYSLAYSKLAAVPVEVKHCNNNQLSLSGSLPVLKDGVTDSVGSKKVVDEFKRQGYDLDVSLAPNKSTDLMSYKLLVEQKLVPAVQYTFWCIQNNYSEVTRPAWSSFLPLLQSIYHPLSTKHSLSNHMEKLHRADDSEMRLNKVMSDAKECLNVLSYKLEEKEYFLGQKPTSLDALVFAQLALLINTNLPNSPLKAYILMCPNLTRFCKRIMEKHFPECSEEIAELEKERQEKEIKKLKEAEDFPHKTTNIITAAGFVSVVLLGYMLAVGMIRFETNHAEVNQ